MSEPITVTVKLFAMIREVVGTDELMLTLSGDPPVVSQVRDHLLSEYPMLMPVLPFSQIAVNEEVVEESSPLKQGDEVAVLPPVSGG